MAKIIQITTDLIESIKEEFEEAIGKAKLSNGTFTFSKNFGKVDRKATLYYREHAWLKQEALIDNFSNEVAWHGIAKRDPDEKDAFIIEDILVYPQEVTGATVTTDQQEYQEWLYAWDDDVFNNIRFQGHSHVNMGVTPSSVDENLYESLLSQLNGDMFYIFAIFNKRGDRTVKIYDMAENIFYENSDVDVLIIQDGPKIQNFIAQAKSLVKTKTYTPATTNNTSTTVNNTGKTDTNGNSEKIPVGSSGKKGKKKSKSSGGYGSYNGYGGYGGYGGYYGDGSQYPYRGYYDDDYFGL